jgi:hypothetical protein
MREEGDACPDVRGEGKADHDMADAERAHAQPRDQRGDNREEE